MEMEIAAWLACTLVFTTFFMKTLVSLRIVAIASNVAFIAYALLGLRYGIFGKILPIFVLHVLLLPLNVVRLREMKPQTTACSISLNGAAARCIRRCVVCGAAAVGVLIPMTLAHAGPVLSRSAPLLIAQTEFDLAFSAPSTLHDARVVAPGTTGLVNVLDQPPRSFLRFPESMSVLPGGFLSALMTHDGFGGVGVSGVSLRTSDALATARFVQSVINTGDAPAPFGIDVTIPAIEVSVLAGASHGPFPAFAAPGGIAEGAMIARYTRADGTTAEDIVFDYRLELRKRFQGSGRHAYVAEFSDDLLAFTPAEIIERGDVFGLRFAEFTEFHRLRTLEPGDSVELDYSILAIGSNGENPELGYQALFGDPFNLSGSAGFRIALAAPAAVAEPGALSLLAVAFILMRVQRYNAKQCNSRITDAHHHRHENRWGCSNPAGEITAAARGTLDTRHPCRSAGRLRQPGNLTCT